MKIRLTILCLAATSWLAVIACAVFAGSLVEKLQPAQGATDTVRGVVRVHEIPEVCQHRPEASQCRDTVAVEDPE